MTIGTMEKSGIVEFKNQNEIIADRQRVTDTKYQALQNRINNILRNNHQIVERTTNHK